MAKKAKSSTAARDAKGKSGGGSSAAIVAKDWVRSSLLPKKLGVKFERGMVKLRSGGEYRFDAVSADGGTVATISLLTGPMPTDVYANDKMAKLRGDMYWLLTAKCRRRVLVLTNPAMYELCLREREKGRIADEIELLDGRLPGSMQSTVKNEYGASPVDYGG